jgi:23S rRNA (uracil1939-C5)-methyltransferase
MLERLTKTAPPFDAVFANPPRRGMAPEVRKAVAALRPRAIAYVSCEPDSLARDLAHFAELGYAAKRIHPVDMIPLTDQVETVAELTPASAPEPATHHDDAELCVMEKPAHLAAAASRRDLALAWSAAEDESGFAVWCPRAALPHLTLQAEYLVLARGIMTAEGRIGKRSTYDRIAKLNGHSYLRVRIEDGNVLDLRKKLARMSHPVVGDGRCGHAPTNRHFEERYLLDRPFLHCVELSVTHPRTRSTYNARWDLPAELGMVLSRLGHLPSKSPND